MLLSKPISITYFLRLIKWDVIAIFLYACIVGALDYFTFFKDLTIPLGVSAMVGTLLSLLLAFRTSQSYERWWEARTVWGAIVNDSRTLIRQLVQFLPNDENKAGYIEKMAIRQSIWCYTLAESLRKCPSSEKVTQYINELGADSDNRPNMLLSKHAEELAAISEHYQLNANKQVQLDSTIQRLTDSMGRCERIKNTVFPRAYSVLIHFLIYVLTTIFPFGLDDHHWVIVIFLATIIPVLFIAIERTAILMQDPFQNKPTDTPMTALSKTIERNLMEMANLPKPVQSVSPDTFYLM
ncbi:bestrophin family protein [Mucilaginibacter aquaedulcis]|uniref:bestrophin family protein n=1 Tax=Mucilaginibacter aquaedulcis TaxID=1187081 RepID=UPI0025B4A7FE|nr:bestrophin family ion channel [Mucilaginibacter aquaedulcis]MDN3548701.1 bestrophin family ion channel [Mucilaginibacter aquaedulcis]